MKILDSGNRTSYETGAVRDIQDDKGRCDLIPLKVIGDWIDDETIKAIGNYVMDGDIGYIFAALDNAIGPDAIEAILNVSVHFKEGAEKYGERNWEKGIPIHSYVDSGIRHYLKYLEGYTDEPHLRAFVWNMLCLIHTHKYIPEMINLPFKTE